MITKLSAKIPWLPRVAFVYLPIALLILFYAVQGPTWISNSIIIIGIILCILFVVYLYKVRPSDLSALASIVPSTFGPMAASQYILAQAPALRTILDNGGSNIVQLAFFFSSWLGLASYLLLAGTTPAFSEAKKLPINLISLGWFIVLVIALFIMFSPAKSIIAPSEGPVIGMGFRAPGLSLLLVGRALITIFSLILATSPLKEK